MPRESLAIPVGEIQELAAHALDPDVGAAEHVTRCARVVEAWLCVPDLIAKAAMVDHATGLAAGLNAVEEWIGEFHADNARRRDCAEPEIGIADRLLERLRCYRRKYCGGGPHVG